MVNFFHHYEDMSSYCTEHTVVAMIYLISDMLLVTGSTRVNLYILSLIYQAINGESIVPIFLVETLNVLDAYHQRSSTFLRGSLRFLYTWLLEHFRSVGFNSVQLDNLTNYFLNPIFSALTMSS